MKREIVNEVASPMKGATRGESKNRIDTAIRSFPRRLPRPWSRLELLQSVIDSTFDSLQVWSPKLDVLYSSLVNGNPQKSAQSTSERGEIREAIAGLLRQSDIWGRRTDHVLSTGVTMTVEDSMVSEDRTFNIESRLSPILDEGGTRFAVGVLSRDVSAQKRVDCEAARKREIRAAAGGLREMIDVVPIAAGELDLSYAKSVAMTLVDQGIHDIAGYLENHPDVIEEVVSMTSIGSLNDHILELFGAESREDLLAADVGALIPEWRQVFGKLLAGLTAGGRHIESEIGVRTLWGEIREVLVSVSVPDSEALATHSLVSVLDVTQVRRMERELACSDTELECLADIATGSLEESVREIRVASDDLTNRFGQDLDSSVREDLDRIRRASVHMKELVSDLARVSRVTSTGRLFVPVDLNRVARNIEAGLGGPLSQIGGDIRLSSLPVIDADELQISHLLKYLIEQALRCRLNESGPYVEVFGEIVDRGFCRISILGKSADMDAGRSGRPQATSEIAEDRVEQGGSTVGLEVCKRIAERHGGSITVDGQLGSISGFEVCLPVHNTV